MAPTTVRFIDEGTFPEGQYVTVVDKEFNPIEYSVLLAAATEEYGDHPVEALDATY